MPRENFMRRVQGTILIVLIWATSSLVAQESASDWDALFERRDGWLAADGIYSIDLTNDVAKIDNEPSSPRTLFGFSDTFGGSTRNDGRDFDEVQMTNHSFAILEGNRPNAEAIEFFWRRDERKISAEKSESGESSPANLLGVERWLQDGIVYRGRIWFSALLVGSDWKPKRVDAVSIGIDVAGTPDFNDVCLDESAPLSYKTETAQVVFGAALCDDADDEFLYIYGYLDRFDVGSRKDLVVARAPRDRFDDFSQWRYFDGRDWSSNLEDACRSEATLISNVSTEFSLSKITNGANAGKLLLVYTPGVISDEIAFRIADTPTGPFGPEVVFYRSTVPLLFARGVRCYNAKAHPILSDSSRILISYNVNRLGSLPKRPSEYRPRFVWLDYQTLDAAFRYSK